MFLLITLISLLAGLLIDTIGIGGVILAPYELYETFIGKEYGDPTEASLDAILLMAEKLELRCQKP